jgi:hypothetical protein
MSYKHFASKSMHYLRIGLTSLALFQFTVGGPLVSSVQAQEATPAKAPQSNDGNTTSPIKHVIVIIGENRSYDHVFATYVPKHGQFTKNLLSEGIVNADGTPGPNFSQAQQLAATDSTPDAFLLSPAKAAVPEQSTSSAPGGRCRNRHWRSSDFLHSWKQLGPCHRIRKRVAPSQRFPLLPIFGFWGDLAGA